MDSRMYPQGTGTVKSKYVAGVLTFSSGKISYGNVALNVVKEVRKRCTLAEVNAGVTLLAAPGAGLAYRMTGFCKMIGIGGAVTANTTVDVLGTRSGSSVKLYAGAQAALDENDVNTNAVVAEIAELAAGLTNTVLDANTAITVGNTGSDMTTATHVDVSIQYVIEAV